MASFTRDAADKATWSQMAKRWLSCAEYYEDQQLALGTHAEMRRRCATSPRVTSQRAGRTLRRSSRLWINQSSGGAKNPAVEGLNRLSPPCRRLRRYATASTCFLCFVMTLFPVCTFFRGKQYNGPATAKGSISGGAIPHGAAFASACG
jgi:hypothetical protein